MARCCQHLTGLFRPGNEDREFNWGLAMAVDTRAEIDNRLRSLCDTMAKTSGMEQHASILAQIVDARKQLGAALLQRDKTLRPLVYGLSEDRSGEAVSGEKPTHPGLQQAKERPVIRPIVPVRQPPKFDPVANALAVSKLENEADELARQLAEAEVFALHEDIIVKILENQRAKGRLLLERDRHYRPEVYAGRAVSRRP